MKFTEVLLLPFKNFKEFLLGVGLFALSEFIVPPIFALGYVLNVYQKAQKMENEMPAWNGWLDLAKKGIVSVLILFIYLLPALLCLILSIFFFTIKLEIVGFLFAAFVFLFVLVSVVLLPVALFQYSKSEEISDAFKILTILRMLREETTRHFSRLGILFVIGIPFALVVLVLRYLLVRGFLLDVSTTIVIAFSQFLIFVLMAEMFGRLYSKVNEKEVKKDNSKNSAKKNRFCPHCGTEIIKKGKFCANCGKKL